MLQSFEFESEASWVTALQDEIEKSFLEMTSPNQVVALAGGTTPYKLYDCLGQKNLDQICFTLTDERLTEHTEGTNEDLIEKTLFKSTSHPNFVSLHKNYFNASNHNENLNDFWKQHNKELHLVILGMGEDGHFASLFPPLLDLATSDVFVSQKGPLPYTKRISLSLNAILKAPKIILAIRGKSKKEILERALKKEDPNFPISFLLSRYKKNMKIYWTE